MDITTRLSINNFAGKAGKACRFLLFVLTAVIVCTQSTAFAQDFEGQAFRIGETRLIPEIRVDYVSIDNAFRDSENEVEATGIIVAPAVSWQADRRLLELSASYRGEYGTFSESELDFTDHDLRAGIKAAPASRHRTSLDFRLLQQAEEFRTGQASFANDINDRIVDTTTSLVASYAYGVPDAKGNVGGGLSLLNRSYNDLGDITDGDDYISVAPFVYFSYRLSPDTRLRLETRLTQLDYDADNRDRTTISVLAGADFAATERTGGQIRLGVSEADFDTAGIDNRTTFVADVNVYYSPVSFARFDLSFNRDLETIDNNVGGAGESIVDEVELSWSHDWSSRFSTQLSLETELLDRECPSIDTATNTVSLEFGFALRRWLSVGAGAATSRRTIDACIASDDDGSRDYDRNSYGVHVTATL